MNFNKNAFIKKILEEFPKQTKLNMLNQFMLDKNIDYALREMKTKEEITNYLLEIIPTEMKKEDVFKFFNN